MDDACSSRLSPLVNGDFRTGERERRKHLLLSLAFLSLSLLLSLSLFPLQPSACYVRYMYKYMYSTYVNHTYRCTISIRRTSSPPTKMLRYLRSISDVSLGSPYDIGYSRNSFYKKGAEKLLRGEGLWRSLWRAKASPSRTSLCNILIPPKFWIDKNFLFELVNKNGIITRAIYQ